MSKSKLHHDFLQYWTTQDDHPTWQKIHQWGFHG